MSYWIPLKLYWIPWNAAEFFQLLIQHNRAEFFQLLIRIFRQNLTEFMTIRTNSAKFNKIWPNSNKLDRIVCYFAEFSKIKRNPTVFIEIKLYLAIFNRFLVNFLLYSVKNLLKYTEIRCINWILFSNSQ